MPQLDLIDINNQKVGTVEVSPDVFDVPVREHLVQQYVIRQLAARRSGTASTKQSMGEMRGTGKKPWRQKGTGRARAGSFRSPLWRGGRTVFGPSPRDYKFKLSKKARKNALKSVLTEHLKNSKLTVMDQIPIENPKTRDGVAFIKSMGFPARTLFLLAEKNVNLELAVRNIPHVNVLKVDGLNAFDLLAHDKIVCTREALKKIEERLN
ncbi:MAG: 50S ribosomal protein L4 [Nitrospinota bacterium]|nr:50S ribosomal protein L4 [Nitrospinota bacterium]